MQPTCPECGGLLGPDSNCQEIFESFLTLEFSEPAYGEVHMLTVACYMIQHGRYSAAALHWIAERLREHLHTGLPVSQIRRQSAPDAQQARRSWHVLRGPADPPPPAIDWSIHISDVAAHFKDAASYRELIRKWAETTLAEMQPC